MDITITFDSGILGDAYGLNVAKSGENLACLLQAAVVKWYPNADAYVKYDHTTTGAPTVIVARRQGEEAEFARARLMRIMDIVYSEGDWQVPE